MITSNSNPQCLHLNSMSQVLAFATRWPQFGQASQLFRWTIPPSIEDPVSMRRAQGWASLQLSER